MSRSRAGVSTVALLLSVVGACAGGEGPGDVMVAPTGAALGAVQVDARVLYGSVMRLTGQGFDPAVPLAISIAGQYQAVPGAPVAQTTVQLAATAVSSTEATALLDEAALTAMTAGAFSSGGGYGGVVGLLGGQGQVQITFTTYANLDPVLVSAGPTTLFLGDALVLQGDGFIGDAQEGQTVALLDGVFTPQDTTAPVVSLSGVEIPTRFRNRTQAELVVTSDLFGIRPGEFVGTVAVRNDNLRGDVRMAGPLPAQTYYLSAPTLVRIAPEAASRGQLITVAGAGFLKEDSARQEVTLLRLAGDFQLDPLTGSSESFTAEIVLFPRVVSSQELSYVLSGQIVDGIPSGLGRVPGTLTGTITPVIQKGSVEVAGEPMRCGASTQCTFRVLPALQVIYIKFLDSFTDGLRRFGMRNVERQVRDQVMAQVAAFYAEWNIDFREQLPTDFVEFSTLEVGGPDPNGAGLFGLDNTDGKDIGNERFNDYVGGSNAASAQDGYYAFGGVFIESFLTLSPMMTMKGMEPNPLASPRFDTAFSDFIPELGGTEVQAAEVAAGPRAPVIAEAIRVLGNLIASTVAHEFGHSLGMSIEPGEFHNLSDEFQELMDQGGNRPFEERAQLDGRFEVFSERHRAYLQTILPRPSF